jgi:hypothetical protein
MGKNWIKNYVTKRNVWATAVAILKMSMVIPMYHPGYFIFKKNNSILYIFEVYNIL